MLHRISQLPTHQWAHMTGPGRVDWAPFWDATGVVVILNFAGEMEFGWADGARKLVKAGTECWFRIPSRNPLTKAQRLGSPEHKFMMIHFPDQWLMDKLEMVQSESSGWLHDVLSQEQKGRDDQDRKNWAARLITEAGRAWASHRMPPHLCPAARAILQEARLTEFLLHSLFPPEGSSEQRSRTQLLAVERVDRVKAILNANLDTVPTLDELAQRAGCTASFLSRTFSEIEGITITLWLRKARITKAAELISSGKCNVSEAALEVGYQSLSHFSKAFRLEMGYSPSQIHKPRH